MFAFRGLEGKVAQQSALVILRVVGQDSRWYRGRKMMSHVKYGVLTPNMGTGTPVVISDFEELLACVASLAVGIRSQARVAWNMLWAGSAPLPEPEKRSEGNQTRTNKNQYAYQHEGKLGNAAATLLRSRT